MDNQKSYFNTSQSEISDIDDISDILDAADLPSFV